MADKQYDVSKKLQRLFEEKQKIREAMRQAVLKRELSPYMPDCPATDPAVVRFHAMLTYRAEHVRPNVRNVSAFCGFIVIPILLTFCGLIYTDKKKEKLYRSGQVAYKDRMYKAVI